MAINVDNDNSLMTELVYPRSLKKKDKFLMRDPKIGIYEVLTTADSKPGKHGSAKTVANCKDIITGKTITLTLKDTNIKMSKLTKEIPYAYKVFTKLFPKDVSAALGDEVFYFNTVFPNQIQFITEALQTAEATLKPEKGVSEIGMKYIKINDDVGVVYLFSEFLIIPVEISNTNDACVINDFIVGEDVGSYRGEGGFEVTED